MAAWLRRSAMDCAARLLAQALVSAPNCLRLIMFAPYALSRRQSLMAVEGTREEQRVEEVLAALSTGLGHAGQQYAEIEAANTRLFAH